MNTHHLRANSRLAPGAALLAAAVVVVMTGLRDVLTAPRAAHLDAALEHGLGWAGSHPSWIALYGAIAAAVTIAVLAATRRGRRSGVAPGHILPVAVAAGTVWPLILLGLAQVAALAGVRNLMLRSR
jgi:hypothetical protein